MFLAVAAMGVIYSCRDEAAPVEPISVTSFDSAGVRIVVVSGSMAALPEWTLSETPLTEVDGGAPPYLGTVGRVAFFGEDGLLVTDGQASILRSFGADGQVLRLMAGKGDGPGEMRTITQLSITPDDSVYAFDVRQNRFTVFGPDGVFAATMSVEPEFAGPASRVRVAWALGSDRFLLHGYGLGSEESNGRPTELPTRVERDGLFRVVSSVGAGLTDLVRFPGESTVHFEGGNTGSPFWNHSIISTNGNRIVHGTGMPYELVVRDLDLHVLLVIRWLEQQEVLTPSTIRAVRGPMSASIPELRAAAPEAADRLIDALFDPDMLPDALPALGSVLIDEAGRIWVSQFRLNQDLRFAMGGGYMNWDERDVWHVLDEDGIPLARVRLPVATRLLAVRSDRVVVVARDDLDVESVRVLTIQPGLPHGARSPVGGPSRHASVTASVIALRPNV